MPVGLTRILLAAAVVGLAATTSGCSTGPADKAELCTSFDALGTQLLSGNSGIGNPLFDAADSLGDVADRYEGSSLTSEAAKLHSIADSDSTDSNELRNATMRMAKICGHPLGLGQGFGRG